MWEVVAKYITKVANTSLDFKPRTSCLVGWYSKHYAIAACFRIGSD